MEKIILLGVAIWIGGLLSIGIVNVKKHDIPVSPNKEMKGPVKPDHQKPVPIIPKAW
jgi:hypothetical protein